MSEHSRLAPSSMARAVQCPGSVTMAERYPEPEGPEAKEGTAAHWAFAELAAGRVVAVGQIAPNGVALDDEMLESADRMADLVQGWRDEGFVVHIEKRVAAPSVHAECWGTPDAWAYSPERRRLRVADLKHGHGFVEAFDNWQLMTYARGALDELMLPDESVVIVDLTVVQPRNYHRDGPVRTQTLLVPELRAHWERAHNVAHLALSRNPATFAGPECKHCPARRACPTLQAAALNVVDDAGRAIPLDLPTDQAAAELRRLDYAVAMASARRSGLEAQLLGALKSGQHVPHFHVEHGQGREEWSVPAEQVFALGDLMGVDVRKTKPITPTQARKLGLDVPGFTSRGTGEASLVPDSPYQAAKIFGKVAQ